MGRKRIRREGKVVSRREKVRTGRRRKLGRVRRMRRVKKVRRMRHEYSKKVIGIRLVSFDDFDWGRVGIS